MKVRFRIGVLLVALAAGLGAASPPWRRAAAKGGGGGGALCAVIQSWTSSLRTTNAGQPYVAMT